MPAYRDLEIFVLTTDRFDPYTCTRGNECEFNPQLSFYCIVLMWLNMVGVVIQTEDTTFSQKVHKNAQKYLFSSVVGSVNCYYRQCMDVSSPSPTPPLLTEVSVSSTL